MERKVMRIIGIMSGTSMDGLDIVCVDFNERTDSGWNYQIIACTTTPFQTMLKTKLNHAKSCSGIELNLLDIELGEFIGQSINQFLLEFNLDKKTICAIASHGHTVFHQPENKLTLQIGNGNAIAKITGINAICNFRERDVMHGGQGAPLVPIGDLILFGERADSFLNLGGFANISKIKKRNVEAFDICPCNLVLNHFAEKFELSYDKNGALGRRIENIDIDLLKQLDSLKFYTEKGPKSLGTEWLEKEILPVFKQNKTTEEVQFRTAYEHISNQIAMSIHQLKPTSTFVSGGGAKNTFLIALIQSKIQSQLIVPEARLIDYKEAIVFGLLGALFLKNQPNCLSSVTGASKNVCGGEMHYA